MRLIGVEAFIKREQSFSRGERVEPRAQVLWLCDESKTEYAILSHRWTEQEVDYNEVVKLAKMGEEQRYEIRHRDGYRKILQSCEQAKKDGHKWLWVDTCCIDKRSSAELSEAINSMYRWYENSKICYAYLHDVPDPSFPTACNLNARYPNGWPEWFSRGWTLQEMIAPRDLQFFNKDWHFIGDKKTHAPTLQTITQVPQRILKEGLSSNRPCVAQIMSWAANRTTTRVEDRAYSLMGLLDVNMPMLYGEGKKAFHRLQLEIIRMSNDQSIFAWGLGLQARTGSILADDPSFFWGCDEMELMNRDEFIEFLRRDIPAEELPSIADDRLGTFPITNRGIHIWLFLRPHLDSNSVFEVLLPCRSGSLGSPVAINLALWESNYYRYTGCSYEGTGRFRLRQVYLRYQDMAQGNSTFEIDDSAITENGFHLVPWRERSAIGNMITLYTTSSPHIRRYSCSQGYNFAVGLGQCFGQNWVHAVYKESVTDFRTIHGSMLGKGPEYARSMKKEQERAGAACSRLCIMRTLLPRSTWILQISCIMWKSSGMCGVKLEVFQDRAGFSNVSGHWTGFDVDGTDDPNRDWRGLMIRHFPSKQRTCELLVDGVSMKFLYAPNDIKLGDYGDFMDSGGFCRKGNLYADLRSRFPNAAAISRNHKISEPYYLSPLCDDIESFCLNANLIPKEHLEKFARDEDRRKSGIVRAYRSFGGFTELYEPFGMSLQPSHDHFKSLLVSLSTQSTNKYVITKVIQCRSRSTGSATGVRLYDIAKPFVWYRNEGADSGGERERETQGD